MRNAKIWAALFVAVLGFGLIAYGEFRNYQSERQEVEALELNEELLNAEMPPFDNLVTSSLPTPADITEPSRPATTVTTVVEPEPTITATTQVPIETTTSTTSTVVTTTTTTTTLLPPPDSLEPDKPFGYMRIERIGMDTFPVSEGNEADNDEKALLGAVARRPNYGTPGSGGNVVIGGHRTSHLRPFYDLDKMQEGDIVEVAVTWGVIYEYRVTDVHLMVPEASVGEYFAHRGGTETITLYACTPKGKVSHRIVIIGELVESYSWQ